MFRSLYHQTIRVVVALTCAVATSSCMTAWKRVDVTPSIDLSSSSSSAVIRGSQSGMNGLDCYIHAPSRTRELIVDAGKVSIGVLCYSWGGEIGGSMDTRIAEFVFQAKPDHAYELVGYATCTGCGNRSRFGFEHVELVDKSDDKRPVLRAPFDYVVRDTHAVVSFRRLKPKDELPCVYLDKESPPGEIRYIPGFPVFFYTKEGRFESTRIDDGHLELPTTPQTISVQCTEPTGKKWNISAGNDVTATFRAQVQLSAQSGHMYRIYMPDDGQQCVQVQDVFEQDIVVECSKAETL